VFQSEVVKSTCPRKDKNAYILQMSRSPLSSKCKTKGIQTETKIVCEPTVKQKAKKFIEALDLGLGSGTGNVITLNRINLVPITPKPTTTPPPSSGIPVACPTRSNEKKICGHITDPCARKLRHRSIEEDSDGNVLLAQLVEAQDDIYRNNRRKRQTDSATNRNIFFVVDSSGSIGRSTYKEVLKVLSEFSLLFCGNVSIGLLTYSTYIDLEFCATCHRELTPKEYGEVVVSKIKGARYHRAWTHTGEVVKCLSDTVLPSRNCPDVNKRTQVVFFTDGKHNGCANPKTEIKKLTSRFPKLETYSIGMGSISRNGVTELINDEFDPNNIFSVKDIAELKLLLEYVNYLLDNGQIECVSTQFPTQNPQ
jgi:hypothetical protein